MKRKIFLLALLTTSLFTSLSSCSKDDDNDDNTEATKEDTRLVGTKWQCDDPITEMFHGGTCYMVYEFVSATEVERYTLRNGVVYDSDGTFKYTLNYPSITITGTDNDGESVNLSYKFTDSRTMEKTTSTTYYSKFLKQ